MQNINNTVLSIGTNIENRLQNIQNSINAISGRIGNVVQTSSIYEFPSWGFKSTPFYNCSILVETKLNAEQLILEVLAIEKDLGRIRSKNNKGYQKRVIDIDIICYNEEIYDTENLIIPHPLMKKRAFVLQPSTELNFNWVHPILKKSFQELLEECDDKPDFKIVQLPKIIIQDIYK